EYITDRFIIEKLPLSRIEEEDVLAIEKMNPKLVAKYKLKKLLTARELARMKKAKIPLKKYPVYANMPVFLPYILASLLLTLLFGDPLAMILGP
ncbi:MAG: hypothetical protein NT157_02115, partial [Candidatus Micrarchaeota archaeon]|nr:hypothetical protein [Candidatus Micrarchaeota archaeon]